MFSRFNLKAGDIVDLIYADDMFLVPTETIKAVAFSTIAFGS